MSLSNQDMLDIYETMLTIRESEERTVSLFKKGELEHGHVLPCLGQEAIPAAFSQVLKSTDFVVTGHRGAGHYIARGGDLNGLWAELYGKRTGVMKGRGGHMHLVDMSVNTIAGNAIVGAQWVLGTGAGLAAKLDGKGSIVVVVGGEGSTNRGTFHEGLNFAAVKKLPIIFVCEFNAYQLWNHASEILPIGDISDRLSWLPGRVKEMALACWNARPLSGPTAEAICDCRRKRRSSGRRTRILLSCTRLHSKIWVSWMLQQTHRSGIG
jgi:pyruvate dehydrogenase E1 component alpha subunit